MWHNLETSIDATPLQAFTLHSFYLSKNQFRDEMISCHKIDLSTRMGSPPRSIRKRGFVAAATFAIIQCTGCATSGPPVIDPAREFAGLRNILYDLPDDGTLEVFLAHGMRADAQQTYADLIGAITRRLNLYTTQDTSTLEPTFLVSEAPNVDLDGVPVFGQGSKDGSDWKQFQPRVTVEHWQTRVGHQHVNFYRFEYWEALAFIKCQFVVAPDTRLIGATTQFGGATRSKFCASQPWNAPGSKQLSNLPELGNQGLKSEIMEWGLSDAVIATSQYRTVLRQAVREAMVLTTRDAIAAAPPSSVTPGGTSAIPDNYKYRFAFITESLGSYVISDALNSFVTPTSSAAASESTSEADASQYEEQMRAAKFAICGATQVHMLANQLALLRPSELTVSPAGIPKSADSAKSGAQTTSSTTSHAHFFRGCEGRAWESSHPQNGVAYGAWQVVAYHDPNDLLTYYTSDRPGTVGAANAETTNVVTPFTTVWIPFLFANPAKAHTGQPKVPAIMDLLACGHSVGKQSECGSK
jgi:hypothetical protein